MSDFTFGISAMLDTPIGAKRVEVKFQEPRHDVKSMAGRMFHNDFVKSVCVFDPFGLPHLYLKKTPDGVIREELP